MSEAKEIYGITAEGTSWNALEKGWHICRVTGANKTVVVFNRRRSFLALLQLATFIVVCGMLVALLLTQLL